MNNVLAAFIMLTRLPFWKIKEVPAECFKHVVPYWPLVGWLTGGVMAAVLWLAGQIMPVSLAWILALIARLLVTGCLHEDGLADFLDGFGGGTTRERTLAIMKDSHIGSYGVIGLICYFLLLLQLHHLPLGLLCILVLSGDCWSKFCASQIVNYLPYARKEEQKQNRLQPHEPARVTGRISLWPASFRTAAAYKAVDCHPLPTAHLLPAVPIDEAAPTRIYGGLLRGHFPAMRTVLLLGKPYSNYKLTTEN
jgi:cobalamin synthase